MATPEAGSAGPRGRPTKTHPKIRIAGDSPSGESAESSPEPAEGPATPPAPGLLTRLMHTGNGLGWLLVCGAVAALTPSEYTYHRIGQGLGGLTSLPSPTRVALMVPWFGWLGAGIGGWVLLAWFEGTLSGSGAGLTKVLVSLAILGLAAGFVAAIFWPLAQAGMLWPSRPGGK